jgi:hypothetical protein
MKRLEAHFKIFQLPTGREMLYIHKKGTNSRKSPLQSINKAQLKLVILVRPDSRDLTEVDLDLDTD